MLVKYGTNGIDGQHRSRSVDHERRRRHRVFGELEERQERMYESQRNPTFNTGHSTVIDQPLTIKHRQSIIKLLSAIHGRADLVTLVVVVSSLRTLFLPSSLNTATTLYPFRSPFQRQRRLVDTGYSRILFVRVQQSAFSPTTTL